VICVCVCGNVGVYTCVYVRVCCRCVCGMWCMCVVCGVFVCECVVCGVWVCVLSGVCWFVV